MKCSRGFLMVHIKIFFNAGMHFLLLLNHWLGVSKDKAMAIREKGDGLEEPPKVKVGVASF